MRSFSALHASILASVTTFALAACSGGGSSGTAGSAGSMTGGGGSASTASGGAGGASGSGATTSVGGAGGSSSSSGGSGGTTTTTTTTTSGAGGGVGPCEAFTQRYGSEQAVDQDMIAGAVVGKGGTITVAGELGGTLHVGGAALVSAGGQDAFVVHLGNGGQIAWAKRFGAGYDDRIKGVARTQDGGSVLVGTFDGSVDFAGMMLTSIAGPDAFVLKLDEAGSPVFLLQFENADARAVAVEASGDILVAGDFMGTTKFGPIQLVSSAADMFVVKLSADGSVAAAKQYASAIKPGVIALASGSSRTYVAGSFLGTIDLGTGPLVSAGGRDVFLARLDDALATVFAKQYGDDSSQDARAVTVMPDGSAALAGSFRGALTFDAKTLTADTQDDAFVARVDDLGQTVFALRFGDADVQQARAITVDSAGSIVVAGGFKGTIDVGDGPQTSMAGEDVFVSWLSGQGVAQKTLRFGGTGDQHGRTVSADPCGALVLGGELNGALPIGGVTLTASGGLDVFVARLVP